jgi:two-component system chemotaxis response regulator CheY
VKRILVVDDEAGPRRALIDLFQGHGYDVLEADNGNHALELLAKEAVDLVITDIVMPDLDGIALLNRIKRHDRRAKVIVLSNSGYGQNEVFLKLARALGAIGAFKKNVDPTDLLALVETATNG